MATLYIREFFRTGLDGNSSNIQTGFEDGKSNTVVDQTVAIGGGSTSSAAFNARTRLVRLHCDAICSVKFGTAPTALTTSARMAAGTTEYFSIEAGTALKVAVISNT